MTAGSRCVRGHRGEEEMRVICAVYLFWSGTDAHEYLLFRI
jgi:hypothetical protein